MNEMFSTLQTKSKILYSMKVICEGCTGIVDERKYLPTKFKGDWRYIIKNLQEFLDHETYRYNNICKDCSSSRSKLEFNEVVVIEIENAYPDEEIHLIAKDDISKSIVLEGTKY